MLKVLVILFTILSCCQVLAITVKTTATTPKLFYRIQDSEKLKGKDYLTVKGKAFVLLAKRKEEKEGYVYWKTVKIRVKDKDIISTWPYHIQKLMKPIEQASTPHEPYLGISLFASPISFAVLNNARNIYAGYNLRTLKSTKHELSHDFAINDSYQKDTTFGFEASSLILNSNLIYDYNNFYGNWTYFAILSYRRQKYNGDYPIKHQYGLGILGLKYKFIKDGKYIKNLDLSYVPLYEALTSDFDVNFPGEKPTKMQRTIRHSFRFRFSAAYEEWVFNYSISYKPAYYFRRDTLDMQDIDLNSTLTIGRTISEKIQLNFTNIYTKDIRLLRASGMRPDNTINSFSINVALSI